MEKEWESSKLNILINDCINIENNINEINRIKEGIKNMNSEEKILISFCPDKDKEINIFLDEIKNFGFIYINEGLDIINKSNIIKSANNIQFLIERLKNKEKQKIAFKLLFQASKDGDTSSDFHRICDGKPHQLIFIKTTKGEIFGGYTKEGFKSQENDIKDHNSFVFSVSKEAIYNIKSNNCYSIYDSKERGPCFSGSGCYIISIKKNMLKDQGNTCIAKESYFEGISKDYEINNGERYFNVKEIEVYQVLFNLKI